MALNRMGPRTGGMGLSGFNPNIRGMGPMGTPPPPPNMNMGQPPPMMPPNQTFQAPTDNTMATRPSLMDRFRGGMGGGLMAGIGQAMNNYGPQAQPQMEQNQAQAPGSMFQRAFARAQPMQQPMPNRRTDMSQFML